MTTTLRNISWKHWKAIVALPALAMVALILTACADNTLSGPDMPLCVTIEPVGALRSDGLGDYSDGVNGVRAVFTLDQGRFSFDTGSRRKANVTIPGFLAQGNYNIHFLISRVHQDPNVDDPVLRDPNWNTLDLDLLRTGHSTPVGLLFFIRTANSATAERVVGFGDYPVPTEVNQWPCGQANPAILTRTDLDTWTLESDTTESHCLYLGFGNQPGRSAFLFKMTLRRK